MERNEVYMVHHQMIIFLCQNTHTAMNFHFQNPFANDLYFYHL